MQNEKTWKKLQQDALKSAKTEEFIVAPCLDNLCCNMVCFDEP
jgi:hypothetical protein